MFTIHLAKEPFKFSCSHFTILSAEHAERLHGHNYQVEVKIQLTKLDPTLGMAFNFNSVKPLIRQICDEFDERILLPTRSPFLRLAPENDTMNVTFGKKKYAFPKEDTLCLPIVNITSEELARHICERLMGSLSGLEFWTSLEVQVEETRGQSVSFTANR